MLELLNRKEATVLSTVNELLRQGLSYPKARSRAVSLLFSEYSSADAAFFSSPNNILALEYCKTLQKLKSSIKPFTLLRKGSGYHDPFLPEDSSMYPSASALRSLIAASTSSQFLTADDLSPQLFYKLLTEKDFGFSDYLDCSTALSDRICKYLSSFTGYT
ncbi:MAG: nucleotidyltransferase family protein [Suilimivivens sp.]